MVPGASTAYLSGAQAARQLGAYSMGLQVMCHGVRPTVAIFVKKGKSLFELSYLLIGQLRSLCHTVCRWFLVQVCLTQSQ